MDLLRILEQKTEDKVELLPLTTTLSADLETPVSAFLKLRSLNAKFLLESAEGVGTIGRYTFIGLQPKYKVQIYKEKSIIKSRGRCLDIPHNEKNDPFTTLRYITERLSLAENPHNLTLLGGLVGHVNYEMIGFLEPQLGLLDNCSDSPFACFYLVDTLIVFDHFKRQMQIIALIPAGSDDSKKSGMKVIEDIRGALKSTISIPYADSFPPKNRYKSNLSQSSFEEIVSEAKENIADGNIFQVVLSQALSSETTADSFQIYRALRMLNPSPYMFYLDMEDFELIGSSPEMLVKLNDSTATLRPIAGTRLRGITNREDINFEVDLCSDEKEKAEHIMLVDLGRNDLGKTCDYGSVIVDRLMEVERFSHVMHLASNITGQLRKGKNQFDLFLSVFPAGTVTGAPKIKAMELIHKMEKRDRGPYAGSVGYFSLSGDMDMCITIRTIIKTGNKIVLQAGAGIVADSIPQNEYNETLNKIQVLKTAIESAERNLL